jgi:hypothetical protein
VAIRRAPSKQTARKPVALCRLSLHEPFLRLPGRSLRLKLNLKLCFTLPSSAPPMRTHMCATATSSAYPAPPPSTPDPFPPKCTTLLPERALNLVWSSCSSTCTLSVLHNQLPSLLQRIRRLREGHSSPLEVPPDMQYHLIRPGDRGRVYLYTVVSIARSMLHGVC